MSYNRVNVKDEHLPSDSAPWSVDEEHNLALDWPVQEIIGEDIIEGQKHYWVMWEPSLISEVNARGAKRLIEEWQARKRKSKLRSTKRFARRNREALQKHQKTLTK